MFEGIHPDDEHGEVSRGEVAHVGDDAGACRHPGDGPGVGEHHQGGGEGEERERRDLEERGGPGEAGEYTALSRRYWHQSSDALEFLRPITYLLYLGDRRPLR